MNNKEASWDAASNYIGLSSPTISINTGWGDSNSDVNGVTQSEPVVTPIAIDDVRNMSSGVSGQGDDSFHPGQYLPNFTTDIGPDFFNFKGLHYGVPEFESNWVTGGAFTPGPFVIYPLGGSSSDFYNTHEGGHFVQFLALQGAYYPLIAVPSLINTQLNWPIFNYTEMTANDLWYWWSGESSPKNPGYIKRK